jgi:hypothetical protein
MYVCYKSCWILRMRSVSDKNCTENENIHFVFRTSFAAYEVMWKRGRAGQGAGDNIMWHSKKCDLLAG